MISDKMFSVQLMVLEVSHFLGAAIRDNQLVKQSQK